jgi:hypothetical protein
MTPTIGNGLEPELAQLYDDGRKRAEVMMIGYGEAEAAGYLPGACPYTLEQILKEDWYPDPLETP